MQPLISHAYLMDKSLCEIWGNSSEVCIGNLTPYKNEGDGHVYKLETMSCSSSYPKYKLVKLHPMGREVPVFHAKTDVVLFISNSKAEAEAGKYLTIANSPWGLIYIDKDTNAATYAGPLILEKRDFNKPKPEMALDKLFSVIKNKVLSCPSTSSVSPKS